MSLSADSSWGLGMGWAVGGAGQGRERPWLPPPELVQGSKSFWLMLVRRWHMRLMSLNTSETAGQEAEGAPPHPLRHTVPPPRPSIHVVEHILSCSLLRAGRLFRGLCFVHVGACRCTSSPGTGVLAATCHRMGPPPPGEAAPTGVLKAEQEGCKPTLPPTSDKELTCLSEDGPGD